MKFEIEYRNTAGDDEGGFEEQWSIRLDGSLIAKAETEAWAQTIVAALTAIGVSDHELDMNSKAAWPRVFGIRLEETQETQRFLAETRGK